MTERESEPTDAEVPVEDALEQRTDADADPGDDETPLVDGPESDLDEADPADRAEQGRTVPSGDDEYR